MARTEVVGDYNPRALAAEAQLFKDSFYSLCEEQLQFLGEKFGSGFRPRLAVVLGSGLGGLAKSSEFNLRDSLSFEDIPGMTMPQTHGHEGRLYWGTIRDLPVMMWAGRVQTTDFLAWNTTPARAARLATMHLAIAKGLGVDSFVLTSAAGITHSGVEEENQLARRVRKGDVVAIADYTTFMPTASPLLAPFDARFGQRFNGKGAILDTAMLNYLQQALGERVYVGSYVLSPSTPNYEGTMDLVRSSAPEALIELSPESVTVVGMSLPSELDVLNSHNPTPIDKYGFDRQVRILAFALGTNDIGAPRLPNRQTVMASHTANPATHEEVSAEGKSAEEELIPAVAHVCERLQEEYSDALSR